MFGFNKEKMNNLKILYIGRKNRGYRSGIGKSGKMIVELLKNANSDVIFIDSGDYDLYLRKKYEIDLIWFYDDTAYDNDNIRTIQTLYGNQIPILVNSTYNDTYNRANKIIKKINTLNQEQYNNVYFAVFSKEIENSLMFKDYKKYIFSVPKTIRYEKNRIPIFSKRKSICLGEYNKFMNSALTDNLNIYQLIRELKEEFKNVNFFALRHYDYDINHKLHPHNANKINNENEIKFIENNITIVDYSENLLNWIKDFKIYLSLINKESFSMIPAEAQSVGTVVIYRNMPQSLNSYFYYSAYMWESMDDLKNAIKTIYYNEDVWNELSKLSILNYQTNCITNLKFVLRLELEKLIIRHKNVLLNKNI